MKKIFFTFISILITLSTLTYGQQKVKASYYADKFQGRLTASGSMYHRDSLTCAHKTLPFGTILKVVNPRNDKVVYVTVTDRGPFIKGRTIDLSYAAAKKIGIIHHGVASVLFSKVDSIEEESKSLIERLEIPDLENLEKIELSTQRLLIPQDNTSICKGIKLIPIINDQLDNNFSMQASLFPSESAILRMLELLPASLPRQKRLIVC